MAPPNPALAAGPDTCPLIECASLFHEVRARQMLLLHLSIKALRSTQSSSFQLSCELWICHEGSGLVLPLLLCGPYSGQSINSPKQLPQLTLNNERFCCTKDMLATIRSCDAHRELHPALKHADFSRVGVFGHSMGAMGAMSAAGGGIENKSHPAARGG